MKIAMLKRYALGHQPWVATLAVPRHIIIRCDVHAVLTSCQSITSMLSCKTSIACDGALRRIEVNEIEINVGALDSTHEHWLNRIRFKPEPCAVNFNTATCLWPIHREQLNFQNVGQLFRL